MKGIITNKKFFSFFFISNLIFADFSAYDTKFFYPEEDFRYLYDRMPFPNIAVDNFRCRGGLRALGQVNIRYTRTPNVRPKECPLSVIRFLEEENIDDVQFFKVWWWHPYAPYSLLYNYITQPWAMERMPNGSPQNIVIASGIFEPQNLEAVDNEIGINSVIERTMNYDGWIFFLGNARFKLSNRSIDVPTSGWFVSVYDPERNINVFNFNIQHRKRAIVIFIEFVYNPYLREMYKTHLNLIPQFISRTSLSRSKSNADIYSSWN